MSSKIALTALLAVAMTGIHARSAAAQETVKVGIVIPMTGTSAAVGREISDAAKLYVAQHGNTVAGKTPSERKLLLTISETKISARPPISASASTGLKVWRSRGSGSHSRCGPRSRRLSPQSRVRLRK